MSLDSIALATKDGVVVGISSQEEIHPIYKTPARRIQMLARMGSHEQLLAEELFDQYHNEIAAVIRFSIRSGLAQLGIAGFNPECTEASLHRADVLVDTLITDLSGGDCNRLIESLCKQIGNAYIARVLLLPPAARKSEVEMPLRRDRHYTFDRNKLSESDLAAIWGGAPAREKIESIRTNRGKIPERLPSGKYFVGTVDANPGDDCWVIEPTLRRNGRNIPVLHDQSCMFDPRRTNGERQVEICNINGVDERLEGVHVVASVYQTDIKIFDCDHQKGV